MIGDPCAQVGPSGCTADGTRSFVCANGVYRERVCGANQKCADGACHDVVCQPNLFLCDGNVAEVCDATGTQDTRTDCDLMGAHCTVGPMTASCQVQACTPSSTFCSADGTAVRKCTIDGSSSDVVQYCADPDQRGNRCAGAACRDRCALLEAQDRSTIGCRFLGASASGSAQLVISNPQPDLPATLTVHNLPSGASNSVTINAGETTTLSWTAPAASGTSLARRAISVTSTVPVQVWLLDGADGVSLHPEHSLSLAYLSAVDSAASQTLSTIATVDNTSVSVTVTGATSAGGAVPAAAAGGVITQMLMRGDVLTLASAGVLTGSRVTASQPVAVVAASPSGALTVPGADALGLDVVALGPSLVVARDVTTVTTELDGTLSLTAGGAAMVQAGQRLHAAAPILVVDQSAGGRDVVPPVEQWQRSLYPAWPGPSATVLLGAAAPVTVTSGTVPLPLTASPSASFASTNAPLSALRPLSAPAPFFGLVRPASGTLSAGHGLASIHP
jgi:hypothetical protein